MKQGQNSVGPWGQASHPSLEGLCFLTASALAFKRLLRGKAKESLCDHKRFLSSVFDNSRVQELGGRAGSLLTFLSTA